MYRHSQVFGRKDPGSSRGSNIFGHGSCKSSLAFWVLHLHVGINMAAPTQTAVVSVKGTICLVLTTKQEGTEKTKPLSSEGHRDRS